MARKKKAQRIIEPLLDRYGPVIEKAFLDAIDQLRSDADLKEIVKKLTIGDLAGALAALNISPAVFSRMTGEIASAFAAGGDAGANSMPKRTPRGLKLAVRFDAAAPEAERLLKGYSATAVAEITDNTVTMARNVLSQGLAQGDNPRTVALNLVGRYDRKLGKRTGGFIGLTDSQQKIVDNAAAELKEGSPQSLKAYLGRKLRNKSFDRYVKKAINTGVPIPADIQQKAISRLKDNFLKMRGDTIGRTEAMASLHMGRYQSFIQAINKGQITPDEVERTWQTAHDSRVRHSHRLMDGQTVGLYEQYTTPNGGKLMYPGDPRGSASEIINCRCTEAIRINFLKRLR